MAAPRVGSTRPSVRDAASRASASTPATTRPVAARTASPRLTPLARRLAASIRDTALDPRPGKTGGGRRPIAKAEAEAEARCCAVDEVGHARFQVCEDRVGLGLRQPVGGDGAVDLLLRRVDEGLDETVEIGRAHG